MSVIDITVYRLPVNSNRYLWLLDADKESIKVPYSDIYYIEKDKNYIVYYTKNGEFRECGTMGEREEDFLRCGFAKCSSTWSDEQATREIYLKPFEYAVKEGNAGAVMSSYNYIGVTWAGAKDALLNGILRDEWKFKGFVLAAGLIALEVLTIRRYQKRKNTVA